MGTGENDSASVPMMTDKGTESWKPLGQHIPNEVCDLLCLSVNFAPKRVK